MRRAMMIDLDRCVGCQACVTSCKERWNSGPGAARDWVHDFEHVDEAGRVGITFYPGLCMQCEDHPCTQDCPTGATYMDENTGVVMVDRDVCIGCGNCISNCAYDARHIDEQKGIVEKCNLCAPYVERGEQPACVATCLAQCRHFGDLDAKEGDPGGELAALIQKTGAKPLVTEEVNIRPKVTFAGDAHRKQILAHGVVTPPIKSRLTNVWTGVTGPLASYFVPAAMGLTVLGGLFINWKNRTKNADNGHATGDETKTLPRHRAGMRVIHWFNLLSWILLLMTGIGLMSSASFALFGKEIPRWAQGIFGGAAPLLRFHVAWGIFWAIVIIPIFLVYKQWGLKALQEIKITLDDIAWLRIKPLKMLGLTSKPLPEQDKYNAGQKLFALAVLVGTIAIVITGFIMAFHLGSERLVAACIVIHKLAVALTLVGVGVHVTMAAILREERPALKSMITGEIDHHHAAHHNRKWVKNIESLSTGGKQ